MWWGANGGHDDFLWTHYQSEDATASILTCTTGQLIRFGFRVVVLLAGHYPWQGILDRHLPALQADSPEALILWGTEVSIAGDAVKLRGDHAAREETSYGLHLFPDLIDMNALRAGRDASAWPEREAPPTDQQHPGVCLDPNELLFGQMGEDARTASAEHGRDGISRVVEHLTDTINRYLGRI